MNIEYAVPVLTLICLWLQVRCQHSWEGLRTARDAVKESTLMKRRLSWAGVGIRNALHVVSNLFYNTLLYIARIMDFAIVSQRGHSWVTDLPLQFPSTDDCGKQLESTNASQAEDEGQSIYCSTCYRKLTNPKTTPPTSPAYVNFDDTECCPRCGTKVYFAEQMLSLGRKWHNQCFTCSESLTFVWPLTLEVLGKCC